MICTALLGHAHNEVNVRNGTPLALRSDHAITVVFGKSKMY